MRQQNHGTQSKTKTEKEICMLRSLSSSLNICHLVSFGGLACQGMPSGSRGDKGQMVARTTLRVRAMPGWCHAVT